MRNAIPQSNAAALAPRLTEPNKIYLGQQSRIPAKA